MALEAVLGLEARTRSLSKLHPFRKWPKGGRHLLGQAAVQYILMVGIVSVAVIGVMQARFTAFKTTMQSVKHEMAQVIGGSRRMPARWYSKEMEDYSAAVASLQTHAGPGGTTAETGAEMAAGAERGTGKAGAGEAGEGEEAGGGEQDIRGYGQGFYAGRGDEGFGGSSELASADAGELGGGGGSKKDKAAKTDFGGADDFGEGVEFEEGGGEPSVDRRQAQAGRGESVTQDAAAPKKASDAVEEEVTKDGSVKKAVGGEEEEKKGGKMKLDWATIIKLVLIIAIIVILIILLLGSVAGGHSEE